MYEIAAPEVQVGGPSIQKWAKAAGILFLVTILAGGIGEGILPGAFIVVGDAAATAKNIVAADTLFRLSFAGWLVEAICDVALALVLYVLLRPVNPRLALLAAFFGVVATAVFAVAEIFYLSAGHVLGGAEYLKTFSPDQLDTLALLFLKIYGIGGMLSTLFYGARSLVFGYLIFESGYLPKVLGAVVAVSGASFVLGNLAFAVGYSSWKVFELPVFPALIALTGWFLVKGVDMAKWDSRARALDRSATS